ncbi:hypothetical protein B0O99DRAFT_636644 [Bisporella sp. PMI_857]|nr:hypothetical protein B0O99DRAFT_636644 [Bisporella sp. PMI_857]
MPLDAINAGLIDLSASNIGQLLEQVCRASIINKNVYYTYPSLKETLELICKGRLSGGIFPHRGRVCREEASGQHCSFGPSYFSVGLCSVIPKPLLTKLKIRSLLELHFDSPHLVARIVLALILYADKDNNPCLSRHSRSSTCLMAASIPLFLIDTSIVFTAM